MTYYGKFSGEVVIEIEGIEYNAQVEALGEFFKDWGSYWDPPVEELDEIKSIDVKSVKDEDGNEIECTDYMKTCIADVLYDMDWDKWSIEEDTEEEEYYD